MADIPLGENEKFSVQLPTFSVVQGDGDGDGWCYSAVWCVLGPRDKPSAHGVGANPYRAYAFALRALAEKILAEHPREYK